MKIWENPFYWGLVSGGILLIFGADITTALVAHWGIAIYFTLEKYIRLMGEAKDHE